MITYYNDYITNIKALLKHKLINQLSFDTEKVVNEVKQQALIEMQRAVAAAEAKASLTVANERMRLERVIEDARKQAKQEILDVLNRQEESNEVQSCLLFIFQISRQIIKKNQQNLPN